MRQFIKIAAIIMITACVSTVVVIGEESGTTENETDVEIEVKEPLTK